MIKAKYVHTNLVAENWEILAEFYQHVFGCSVVPPLRDYKSKELELGTGIPNAQLRGVHLKLPGYDDKGPTLEIFSYTPALIRNKTEVNKPGYGHIAFNVDDVEKAKEEVLSAGGKEIGKVVILKTTTGARVKWCYVTDPEGNIIELQSWS